MENRKNELRDYYILWSTQSLSQLGSSVTAFALTLWLYETTGSALSTAALTICSYLPYVLLSIFAGAVSDRFDKKKTMLVCDTLAALCTLTVFLLYSCGSLRVWHLYAVNALSGLMNTVQQPASEVATTLLVPPQHYQRAGSLNSLSRSLISVLNPLIATALYSLAGLNTVIILDLASFTVAFIALLFFIRIPEIESTKKESVLKLASEGLEYLRKTPLILSVILFMSGVNLVASSFDAVLPALVIPNPAGGKAVLGIVTSCAGIAMIAGSLLAGILPEPRSRVRVIYLTMLFSLGTENYLLALSRSPVIWCLGQIAGWILVPVMSTNIQVLFRNTIPVQLQGRVFACRNTLQFFTIPLGLFLGGAMVDKVCEPYMAGSPPKLFYTLFGTGKGAGAALMMFILGVAGTVLCLVSGRIMMKYSKAVNERP